jgi:hypothetical protein
MNAQLPILGCGPQPEDEAHEVTEVHHDFLAVRLLAM